FTWRPPCSIRTSASASRPTVSSRARRPRRSRLAMSANPGSDKGEVSPSMNLQSAVELILALGALSLLVRDLRRAWRDALRRPVTLFAAALFAILLIGSFGGRPHPHPWWLALPAAVLAWEAVR